MYIYIHSGMICIYIYTPVYTYITGMKFQHTLDINIYIHMHRNSSDNNTKHKLR